VGARENLDARIGASSFYNSITALCGARCNTRDDSDLFLEDALRRSDIAPMTRERKTKAERACDLSWRPLSYFRGGKDYNKHFGPEAGQAGTHSSVEATTTKTAAIDRAKALRCPSGD